MVYSGPKSRFIVRQKCLRCNFKGHSSLSMGAVNRNDSHLEHRNLRPAIKTNRHREPTNPGIHVKRA